MIYFIQAGGHGSIKIGFAIEPWKRIKQLQTGSHDELSLLKSIPGDKRREAEIHRLLSPYKKQGEWYHPTSEVIEFIKNLDEPEYEANGLQVYTVLRRDTEDSATDACPFCGKKHMHGIGDGHRVAHCLRNEAKEEIKIEDRLTLRQSDGYIIRTRWKVSPIVK